MCARWTEHSPELLRSVSASAQPCSRASRATSQTNQTQPRLRSVAFQPADQIIGPT
jgi:hypothetical protein